MAYDNPHGHGDDEVTTGPGDSGGPNFAMVNGFRKVAGVTSHILYQTLKNDLEDIQGLANTGNWGEMHAAMRVAYEGEDPNLIDGHLDWIDSVVDITAPRVESVTVGAVAPGSGSLHSDYIVEDGFDGQKALQLETVPVGKANLIAFTFSEAVDLTSATLALDGINGINYEAVFDAYDPTTFTGKWIVTPPLANTDPPDTGAPDQVEFMLSNVTDLGGVRLDGEWNNPDSTTDSSVDTFPSGDGSADGMNDFVLRLNFITADFNQDNVIDGGDFRVWNSNKFTVPNPVEDGSLKGDANGDNVIDGSDFGIWNSYKFTLWTGWRGSPGTGCEESAMGGGGGSSFVMPSAAWHEQYRRVVEFHNIFVNGQVNNSLSASDWERFADAVMALLDQL